MSGLLRVLLHGPLREAAGTGEVSLERRGGETAGALRRRVAAGLGEAGALALKCAVTDGRSLLSEGEPAEGDVLELLPPVSGG